MFPENNHVEQSHDLDSDIDSHEWSSVDLNEIKLLSYIEFLELVLVPEVAVILIAADLNISTEHAVDTWANSAQYGRRTFPASDDDIQQAVSGRKGKGKGNGKGKQAVHVKKEVEAEETLFHVIFEDGEEILVID